MKKILLLFATTCALVACDPVQEDYSIGGNISAEELKEKSTVKLVAIDEWYSYAEYIELEGNENVTEEEFKNLPSEQKMKMHAGDHGNVVVCETHAPVAASWNIAGKNLPGAYVTKKLKLGEQVVTLTALCADGTELKAEFPITVDVITNPLIKYYFYGDPKKGQAPVEIPGWNSNFMRFSKTDSPILTGKLPDNVYWGFKTLIYDCAEGTDATVKVMSGWWDNVNVDDQHWGPGENELPLTQKIAEVCAEKDADGNKSDAVLGHELTTMVTSGTVILNAIYYEE